MKERQLLALKFVVELGTISKAAERLDVTQSAVSQMLTALEADLGFPLLVRRQGRTEPTPQGLRFLSEAEDIIEKVNKARRAADSLRSWSMSHCRVAATTGFAMSLLPDAIAEFRALRPQVPVSFQAHRSQHVRELLSSRIVDLGLCEPPWPSEIRQLEIFDLECVCVLRNDDSLARLDVVRPEDLRDRSYVSLYGEHPTSKRLSNAFLARGIAWSPIAECNLFAAASRLVAARGASVTWADPHSAAMCVGSELCVRPFEPRVGLQLGLIAAANPRTPGYVQVMSECIRRSVSQAPNVTPEHKSALN